VNVIVMRAPGGPDVLAQQELAGPAAGAKAHAALENRGTTDKRLLIP
jgi:hypothetical protein